MIAFEAWARPLLIFHAALAVTLVATTTHHVVWLRHAFIGRPIARARGEKRFVWIVTLAYVATFTIGNLLYPTYKVRVRAEYFDNPPAIAEETRLRAQQREQLQIAVAPPPSRATLGGVARTFDIKEHAVALGCAASILLLVLCRGAHPSSLPEARLLYLGLALFCCFTAWLGALIGLYTASVRSVAAG